ncbi:MAG: hypothetical protein LBC77_03190 [Spirochaetaceae bacterium]|nr:hypothetical protein [Spirochaetaceae bacterium]
MKKTLLFLLPVAALLCLFEAALRTIPNNFVYKKERMITDAQNIDVLILGSSHAMTSIDPAFISPHAFNAGNSAQRLDMDYKLLRKYGEQMKNLRCVIISLSDFSLISRMADEPYLFRRYIIYHDVFFGLESFSPKNYFEICDGTFVSNIKKLLSYYKENKTIITRKGNGFIPHNQTIDEAEWEDGKLMAAFRKYAAVFYQNDRDVDYNEKILTSIIDWCAARNIQLFFVTVPVHKIYLRNYDFALLRETIAYMERLAQQNTNVTYENFFFEYQDIPEYFSNPNHLNATGARVFSVQIREILRARGLLE